MADGVTRDQLDALRNMASHFNTVLVQQDRYDRQVSAELALDRIAHLTVHWNEYKILERLTQLEKRVESESGGAVEGLHDCALDGLTKGLQDVESVMLDYSAKVEKVEARQRAYDKKHPAQATMERVEIALIKRINQTDNRVLELERGVDYLTICKGSAGQKPSEKIDASMIKRINQTDKRVSKMQQLVDEAHSRTNIAGQTLSKYDARIAEIEQGMKDDAKIIEDHNELHGCITTTQNELTRAVKDMRRQLRDLERELEHVRPNMAAKKAKATKKAKAKRS